MSSRHLRHDTRPQQQRQQPSPTMTLPQASTLHTATTPAEPPPPGPELTLTGIPVNIIWLPYVGFSAILIVLMFLSFYQYHRKHGHKYHHAKDELNDTNATSSTTVNLDGHVVQRGGGGRPRQTSIEQTIETQFDNSRQQNQNNSSSQRPHSRTPSTHAYVDSAKAPPNGRVPTAQPPGYKHKYKRGSQDMSVSEQLIQPSHSELVTSRAPPTGSRSIDGHRRQLPKRPTTATTQCDEPSTASSTVSSKNSAGDASKAMIQGRPLTSKQVPVRVMYEPDQNGSMVDVRVLVDGTETFQSQRRRDKPHARRHVSRPPPYAAEVHFRTDLNTTSLDRHSTPGGHMPDITDRIYRGNYVQSRSTSPHSIQQQPSSQCRRTTSFNQPMAVSNRAAAAHAQLINSERSGSLPLWSAPPTNSLPLHVQSARMGDGGGSGSSGIGGGAGAGGGGRDQCEPPFTASGNMQMLSDTEDDETCLLSPQ